MAKEIPLTRGFVAIVDDEDFEWLSQWKWHAHGGGVHTAYARRRSDLDRSKLPMMHREILGANPDQCVDHINRNGLDNRRSNLRLCSHSENSCNKVVSSGHKSSLYKGVNWHKGSKKWAARVKLNGRSVHVGYFDSERAAAIAYDARAIDLFGPFACTNASLGLYEK